MTSGENIHNAFSVVFKTFQNIEKLMNQCKRELEQERYYMPTERFLRYRSDLCWEGWICWSFILLFQRRADGVVMDNGWIDGSVYAVEINVDSETCQVPLVYIAKMDFEGMSTWSEGCSPSNHSLFYQAIHEEEPQSFWGLKQIRKKSVELTELRPDNYRDIVFGMIERLSKEQ